MSFLPGLVLAAALLVSPLALASSYILIAEQGDTHCQLLLFEQNKPPRHIIATKALSWFDHREAGECDNPASLEHPDSAIALFDTAMALMQKQLKEKNITLAVLKHLGWFANGYELYSQNSADIQMLWQKLDQTLQKYNIALPASRTLSSRQHLLTEAARESPEVPYGELLKSVNLIVLSSDSRGYKIRNGVAERDIFLSRTPRGGGYLQLGKSFCETHFQTPSSWEGKVVAEYLDTLGIAGKDTLARHCQKEIYNLPGLAVFKFLLLDGATYSQWFEQRVSLFNLLYSDPAPDKNKDLLFAIVDIVEQFVRSSETQKDRLERILLMGDFSCFQLGCVSLLSDDSTPIANLSFSEKRALFELVTPVYFFEMLARSGMRIVTSRRPRQEL